MRTVLILVGFLLLVSCRETMTQSRLIIRASDLNDELIQKTCQEISTEGDILLLLEEIRKNKRKVMKLLDGDLFRGIEKDLQRLAGEISRDSERVMTLVKEEWTSSRVELLIHWDIPLEKHAVEKNLDEFTELEIFQNGIFREDLQEYVTLKPFPGGVRIEYVNRASLLEACQLIKTLFLSATIRYGTATGGKTVTFNLNVD